MIMFVLIHQYIIVIILINFINNIEMNTNNVNGKCLNHWIKQTNNELVAFTLSPCFTCKYSSFQNSMYVKWDCEQVYNLKINGTMNSIPFEQISHNELRIFGTRESISASNSQLYATYKTSYKQASLQLTLKLIAHYSSINYHNNNNNINNNNNFYNQKSRLLQLHFMPILNENKQSIKYFQLFWFSSKITDYTVLIYNTTHILQYETQNTVVCLENLTEGIQYKFCLVETLYTCMSTSWNCMIKTIPKLNTTHQSSSSSTTFQQLSTSEHETLINNLKIQNYGSHWLQLTWLPISTRLFWRLNELPYAYIIIANGLFKTLDCSDRIYSIQAPWAHNSNSTILSSIHQELSSHRISSQCSINHIYQQIQLFNYLWPEWYNTLMIIEQINYFDDEWGLVNEFSIELNNLQPLQIYNITIKPLFHEFDKRSIGHSIITEKLNPPSMDCNLTLEQTNHGETVLSWSLPLPIKSTLLALNNSMYLLHIDHIGRPEKNLEETCFAGGCQMNNSLEPILNFLPKSPNEPHYLNCYTIKLSIPSHQITKFKFTCQLIPCKLYEITVQLLYYQQLITAFRCKRRFVIQNGLAPNPPSNVNVKSFAHNMILFEIDKSKSPSSTSTSVVKQCNTFGYIISINNNNTHSKPYSTSHNHQNYIFVSMNHLQNTIQKQTQKYYSMNHNHNHNRSTIYRFFIENPFPSADRLSIRIQSVPVNDNNWLDLHLPLMNSGCYLDCIWPNQPPYYRFPQLNNNQYLGRHTSYVIPQSMKNNLQIFQCPMMTTTDKRNSHVRQCQFNAYLQLSEHTFCMDEHLAARTCFIPTCDETALLSCVTLSKPILVNSSTIEIEWFLEDNKSLTRQETNYSSSLQFTIPTNQNDYQMNIDSYLIILYQFNEMDGIKYEQCAQYIFMIISKDTHENWKNYFYNLIIQSLIHSCLGQIKRSEHSELFSRPTNLLITFNKLIPSTLYEINIIPFNQYGEPGVSWRKPITTTVAIPCKPEHMEIYNIESHALSIKWFLSRNIYCGYPTRILIYYQRRNNNKDEEDDDGEHEGEWLNIDTEYTIEHIRLSSLKPCQLYCIQIKFMNNAGVGPISNRICDRTKRAAFTSIPTLTSELIQSNQLSMKQYQHNNNNLPVLRLQIHLNYTNYCPVHYEFLINIYNDEQNPMVIVSSKPEIILHKTIQRGILYQLRGRVCSNESVTTGTSKSPHEMINLFEFSQWTPIRLFYVNMSHFEFKNFTINVQHPMTEILQSNGDYYYYSYHDQCLLNNEHTNVNNNTVSTGLQGHHHRLDTGDFNNNDNHHRFNRQYFINHHSHSNKQNHYCLQLKWNITGQLNGLLGFAIQFFIPFKQIPIDQNKSGRNEIHLTTSRSSSTSTTTSSSASSSTSGTDHSNGMDLQQCAQFIWLPCSGCLINYSLHNVHPRVLEKLKKLIDICKIYEKNFHQTSFNNKSQSIFLHTTNKMNTIIPHSHRHVQFSTIDNLQIELDALKLYEFKQIPLNETLYTFDYYFHIINPTIMLMMRNTHYTYQKRALNTLNETQSFSSKIRNSQSYGYVIIYSVTADDVIYSIKQKWRLNDEFSSSNLSGIIFMGLIVTCVMFILLSILITLIIVFHRKNRSNQTKFIGLHTIEYCEDEEDGYELHGQYKSPVIPSKIPRQPDPINIHDFINWFEKNMNSLKEEFKSLNIHSYRQEQAKHLTCQIGQRPENRLRNKYRNLLPFDQNIVQLSNNLILPKSEQIVSMDQLKENAHINTTALHSVDENHSNHQNDTLECCLPGLGMEQWIASNYINASWISSKLPGISNTILHSGQLPCRYIAAQAPLDHTRSLFWQMIWDHQIQLIVILTKPIENGKDKCSVYWPTNSIPNVNDVDVDDDDDDDDHCTNEPGQLNSQRTVCFGRFKIQLLSEKNYSTYIRRSLKLYDCKTLNNEQHRNIIQLHMLNWPDFSTPSKEDFLRLLYAYWSERRLSMNNNSPVLVHCSAGVGRTGTFICLDQLCQQVRYYLQPNLQIFLQKIHKINEPIYVNLNKEDSGVDEEELENFSEESFSLNNHNNDNHHNNSNKQDETNDDDQYSILHENLLNTNKFNESAPYYNARRTKRFLFHRLSNNNNNNINNSNNKTQTINVFNTVLWLRSKRSHLVQTVDQYIFIYEFLAYFIKQIKEQDRIYENI
ncbi:unnamed protein product [Schistosoma turkestanicum]|nr:unnamed protein product [Schistosoma turkestanicum]